MHPSSKFSLLVFAPVLIALILPALFLLPAAIFIAILFIFDRTVPFLSTASYGLWVLVPVAVAAGLFFLGRRLHAFYLRERFSRRFWAVIWFFFTLAAFLASGLIVAILTSLGASDSTPSAFFNWTALVAAALTLLAQILVIPWLYLVSVILQKDQKSSLSGEER